MISGAHARPLRISALPWSRPLLICALALVLPVALAAPAARAATDALRGKSAAQALPIPGPAASSNATDDRHPPFVLKSYIFAPEQAGASKLVDTSFDPDEKRAGAGFTYRDAAQPNAHISVFVYPLGAMNETVAMQRGMQDFRENLEFVQKHGIFSELKITGAAPFEAPRRVAGDTPVEASRPPPPAGTPLPSTTTADTGMASPGHVRNALDERIARAIAEASPGDTLHGQRLQMQMLREGTAYASLGYLFYKQLYLIKVRISVPAGTLDMTAFTTFGDRVVRAIVPRIETVNVGACGTIVLPAGNSAASSEDIAVQLARDSTRVLADNCTAKVKEPELLARHHGDAVLAIHYDADDWTSSP